MANALSSSSQARSQAWWTPCFRAIVLVEVLLRVAFWAHWRLDFDETQALHAAYSVAKGLVPYRDFWENHTPLFYYFFAPLFAAGVPGEASIFVARGVVALLGLGTLGLTYRIARRFLSEAESWGALALLGACGLYAQKIVEARPDIFYVLFFLAAIDAILAAAPDERRGAVKSGLWLGLAFCATPKALFAAGALGLGVLAWGAAVRRWRSAWAQVVWLGLGFLVPVAFLVGACALAGALAPFWRWIFVFNFTVPSTSAFPPWKFLWRWDVMPLLLVGMAGLADVVAGVVRRDLDRRWLILAVTAAILMVSYAFLMPMPYAHSALPFCPLLAIGGARLAFRLSAGLRVAILAGAVLLPIAVLVGDGKILWHRSHDLELQLEAGARIREIIGPDEAYFSSEADAVTRPHAGFFPVLVREVLEAIHRGDYPPADLPGVIATLRDGHCPLIVMNDFLAAGLTDAQRVWIADHYISVDASATVAWNNPDERYQARHYFVPGKLIDAQVTQPDEPVAFEVVVPGRYSLTTAGASRVLIDGQVVEGDPILSLGSHTVSYDGFPKRIMLRYQTRGMAQKGGASQ